MKTIILGIDGATFGLIKPLVEKDKLPNFRRLMEKGSFGEMINPGYFASATAWTTLTTGRNPGEHGFYDFLSVGRNHEFKVNTAIDKKIKSFWDFTNKKIIVANMPCTYPPIHDNKNLKVISGMLTPGLDSKFTYPTDLKQEILNNIKDYKITLDWELYVNNEAGFMEDLKKMIDVRFKLFDYLIENKGWDVFMGVMIATDRLQHLFWDEKNILEIYTMLDEYIGHLIKRIDKIKDGVLFVISDHGFAEIDNLFYLNTWLKENGFLSIKKENLFYVLMRKIGINREFIAKILKSLGVDTESLRMKLPNKIKNLAPAPEINIFQNVNWEKTKAFFYGFGNLFINKKSRYDNGIVADDEIENLKREIKSKLEKHEAIDKIYDKNELFHGKSIDSAPELIVKLKDKYAFSKVLSDTILSKRKAMKADHHPSGVFFAYGKNVKEGYKRNLGILDFAPTLLYSVTGKKNFDLEGKPLLDIFKREINEKKDIEESNKPDEKHLEGSFSEEEENKIKQRLKSLGYLN